MDVIDDDQVVMLWPYQADPDRPFDQYQYNTEIDPSEEGEAIVRAMPLDDDRFVFAVSPNAVVYRPKCLNEDRRNVAGKFSLMSDFVASEVPHAFFDAAHLARRAGLSDPEFDRFCLSYNRETMAHTDLNTSGLAVLVASHSGDGRGLIGFPEYRASVVLRHGTLVLFEPSRTLHVTKRVGGGDHANLTLFKSKKRG